MSFRGRAERPPSGFRGRLWGAALLLLTSIGGACRQPGDTTSPPDVVLVLVDTLRADHLSTYGYDRETSPFLTEFAKGAVVFENARAQAGCTFPSANSLLTSQPAALFLRTMATHGWAIPPSMPTLASALRDHGYHTIGFSASPIVRDRPGRQNPDGGFGRGFDVFDDTCEREPGSCLLDRALPRITNATGPLFLFLHFFDPHDPYQPPASHPRSFAVEVAPKAWVDDGSLIPVFRAKYKDGPPVDFDSRDLAHTLDLYDEEILYLDGQLERLVLALEDAGRFENTLFVVASDHGEAFLEHGDLFHCKNLGWDTLLATPLIIRTPGGRDRGRRATLAENLDIAPTVLDQVGLDPSDYGFAGVSLNTALHSDQSVRRYQFAAQKFTRTVRDGRFKLHLDLETGAWALYDLEWDPREQIDVRERRPDVTRRLRAALERWIRSVEGEAAASDAVSAAGKVTERLRALGYL